jgi:hypothetical protein
MTLPVLRAEFSAPKMGKFLEPAEIHAPLISLPASVRSFDSPDFHASSIQKNYQAALWTQLDF